jgi:tRNA modification GTPase
MSSVSDTIAALATVAGTSALAIIRISGKDTRGMAMGVAGLVPPARLARHADYRDVSGVLVDDVILVFFERPKSYTGEDSLEISCHGNPFITQRILEDLFRRGCRPAEPGEFTRRAYLNGRMDLSQAEAVMDLINARSERALAAANQQMRGSLGRRMQGLIEALVGVLARIEAYIDFPEEDLPPEDRHQVIEEICHIILETNELRSTTQYGELLRDGIKTVILGAPNAGKSSLLNRLIGRDRALVSSEPGTTRDFLEERVILGSHCLRLIDTAGFSRSPAPLEELGMRKTLERALESDLQLVVLDATKQDVPPFPDDLLRTLGSSSTIIVINKIDLARNSAPGFCVAKATVVEVSALTGVGIDLLLYAIKELADVLFHDPYDMVTVNARHAKALCDACDWLAAAKEKLTTGGPVELVASDLRGVMDAFGEIAGKIDNERVLDQLFATFCIGK